MTRIWRNAGLLAVCCLLMVCRTTCAEMKVKSNLSYGPAPQHLLDLYLAEEPGAPLIVWVHGGAWRSGSKDNVPIEALVGRGYNIASVEYRLSPVARFPAQVHDIKAAIRYLRGHAEEYGYDGSRFAIAGSSAGGHLAALVGVTNGHSELEGAIGDHRDQPSDIQAIIDLYGPTNFLTILKQSTPHGLSVRVPALQLLMGGQPGRTCRTMPTGQPGVSRGTE